MKGFWKVVSLLLFLTMISSMASGFPVLADTQFVGRQVSGQANMQPNGQFSKLEGEQIKATDSMVRFHVVANSDSEEDQALKRAVRDAILREVSPSLAGATSIEESRKLIQELSPEMERIAQAIVQAWGKDYQVKAVYGDFFFPTKSYGTLVLPAGEYEALRVVIGQGEGSNWWCVLFPALCFVDIEHATAVQVDGQPGIPMATGSGVETQGLDNGGRPQVKFWLWEKIKLLFV